MTHRPVARRAVLFRAMHHVSPYLLRPLRPLQQVLVLRIAQMALRYAERRAARGR